MDWEDLHLVLQVVRAGSAASAARELGASASTVTRRIAALEDQLGATLFLRTRDGLRPTDTARRLFDAAVRVEAEVRRAERVVAREDGVEGVVRIATTEGLATLLVERGLLSLLEQHPGLTIELLSGNRPVDLGAGEADLALRLVRPEAGEVRVRKLAELELAVCASSGYLARRGAPRSEAELAGHRVLVSGGELARLPESRWLAELPGVRVALRTASMPALIAATRAGIGVAALPVAWARLDGLEVLFPAPVPPRPLWLAVAPDAASRPAVRAVAERLATLVEAG